jgi:ABC-type transport system involved in multi-copper enzyme maturation permease subunit
MRNVFAIADKELRSYFASPIAYVIIGLFACCSATSSTSTSQFFVRNSDADDGDGGRRTSTSR